jgi:hypothetical protein
MEDNPNNFTSSGTWMTPEMYLEEYKKHSRVLTTGSSEYVFAYLFLHLYFENFIHYHLRMIVDGLPLASRQTSRFNQRDSPMKKLTAFKELLDSAQIQYNSDYFQTISVNYRKISEIRNLLVHGYPIEEQEKNGEKTLSDARMYLQPKSFGDILKNANLIVENWNDLLKEVRQQKDKLISVGLNYDEFFGAEILHKFKISRE